MKCVCVCITVLAEKILPGLDKSQDVGIHLLVSCGGEGAVQSPEM